MGNLGPNMGMGTLSRSNPDKGQDRLINMFSRDLETGSRTGDQQGHNRKMSQSELSSVGSESPGNSGRDERGSLIGERGRSTQRNRNINRAASKGKGSSIGKRDPGEPGEKRNLAEAGYFNMD